MSGVALAMKSVSRPGLTLRILKLLGKEKFTRGYSYEAGRKTAVPSHLLRISLPAKNETFESFRQQVAELAIADIGEWITASFPEPFVIPLNDLPELAPALELLFSESSSDLPGDRGRFHWTWTGNGRELLGRTAALCSISSRGRPVYFPLPRSPVVCAVAISASFFTTLFLVGRHCDACGLRTRTRNLCCWLSQPGFETGLAESCVIARNQCFLA